MRAYVRANNGYRSADMGVGEASAYAVLLRNTGNHRVRVVMVK